MTSPVIAEADVMKRRIDVQLRKLEAAMRVYRERVAKQEQKGKAGDK